MYVKQHRKVAVHREVEAAACNPPAFSASLGLFSVLATTRCRPTVKRLAPSRIELNVRSTMLTGEDTAPEELSPKTSCPATVAEKYSRERISPSIDHTKMDPRGTACGVLHLSRLPPPPPCCLSPPPPPGLWSPPCDSCSSPPPPSTRFMPGEARANGSHGMEFFNTHKFSDAAAPVLQTASPTGGAGQHAKQPCHQSPSLQCR